MLIPQFSLRWLLGATTLVAVLCAIVAWGLTGQRWAIAVSIGLASLVLLMAVYALFFTAIWGLSLLLSRRTQPGQSPFQSRPQSRS